MVNRQWRNEQAAIGCVGFCKVFFTLCYAANDIAMTKHCALGNACSAAGVLQYGQIVQGGANLWQFFTFTKGDSAG